MAGLFSYAISEISNHTETPLSIPISNHPPQSPSLTNNIPLSRNNPLIVKQIRSKMFQFIVDKLDDVEFLGFEVERFSEMMGVFQWGIYTSGYIGILLVRYGLW